MGSVYFTRTISSSATLLDTHLIWFAHSQSTCMHHLRFERNFVQLLIEMWLGLKDWVMQRPNRMANENRSLMDLHDTMPCPPANYIVIIQGGILLILNFSKGKKKKKKHLPINFLFLVKKKKTERIFHFREKKNRKHK